MNINIKTYVVFFILIFALSACKTTSGTKWIEIDQEPLAENEKSEFTIIVEKKNSPEDEVNTYRGTTTMPISIERIAYVLDDTESKKEWVSRLKEETRLEENPSSYRSIAYQHYNLSWPVSDRDYVIESKWTVMKDMKLPTAILSIKSIIRDDVPEIEGRVRGQLDRLVYKLEKLKSNQTRVTVEIMVNPKGLLPNFMINLIQKEWPITTLRQLNAQALKGSAIHEKLKNDLKMVID
ncbi:MAG: hypothetical protein CL937_03055 [Deltaproteobacteria bacterium]|nr:hypothetical protein [Deltaproteobacteria bacterium]OUW00641.1 MAG: hypothetical protein CBD14_03510 [Proteobacteria bacterium TMED154]